MFTTYSNKTVHEISSDGKLNNLCLGNDCKCQVLKQVSVLVYLSIPYKPLGEKRIEIAIMPRLGKCKPDQSCYPCKFSNRVLGKIQVVYRLTLLNVTNRVVLFKAFILLVTPALQLKQPFLFHCLFSLYVNARDMHCKHCCNT